MVGQPALLDLSLCHSALSTVRDPVERSVVGDDFEVFRGPLLAALLRSACRRGGWPPFDPVMMLTILVL